MYEPKSKHKNILPGRRMHNNRPYIGNKVSVCAGGASFIEDAIRIAKNLKIRRKNKLVGIEGKTENVSGRNQVKKVFHIVKKKK